MSTTLRFRSRPTSLVFYYHPYVQLALPDIVASYVPFGASSMVISYQSPSSGSGCTSSVGRDLIHPRAFRPHELTIVSAVLPVSASARGGVHCRQLYRVLKAHSSDRIKRAFHCELSLPGTNPDSPRP